MMIIMMMMMMLLSFVSLSIPGVSLLIINIYLTIYSQARTAGVLGQANVGGVKKTHGGPTGGGCPPHVCPWFLHILKMGSSYQLTLDSGSPNITCSP